MSEHIVAWDKDGPIKVEMILGSAGETFPITGNALVEAEEAQIKTKPLNFAGRQWLTRH